MLFVTLPVSVLAATYGQTRQITLLHNGVLVPVDIRMAEYAPHEYTEEGRLVSAFYCEEAPFLAEEIRLFGKEWKVQKGECQCPNGEVVWIDRLCYSTFGNNAFRNEKVVSPITAESRLFIGMEQMMRPTSLGNWSENNKNLQIFLREMGWFSDPVDGIFSLKTLGALRRYQYEYGLVQTGRPDIATQQFIRRDIMLKLWGI